MDITETEGFPFDKKTYRRMQIAGFVNIVFAWIGIFAVGKTIYNHTKK